MNCKPQHSVDLNSTINLLAVSSNSTNALPTCKAYEPDKLRHFYESHVQNEMNLDDTYDLLGSIAVNRGKKIDQAGNKYCQNLKLNESLDKEEEELLNAIYSKHKINFGELGMSCNPPNSLEFKTGSRYNECIDNNEFELNDEKNIALQKEDELDANYGSLIKKIEMMKLSKTEERNSDGCYNCFTLGNSIEIESEDKLNFMPDSKPLTSHRRSLIEILGLSDTTINIRSGYPSQIVNEFILLCCEEETRIRVQTEINTSKNSSVTVKREHSSFINENCSKRMEVRVIDQSHMSLQNIIILKPNTPLYLKLEIAYPKSFFEGANVEYYASHLQIVDLNSNEELILKLIGSSEKPIVELLSDDIKQHVVDSSVFKLGRESLLTRKSETGYNNFLFSEGLFLLPIINRSFNNLVFKVEIIGRDHCPSFNLDIFPPKLTLRSNKTEFIKLSVEGKTSSCINPQKAIGKFVIKLSLVESKLAYYFMFTNKDK